MDYPQPIKPPRGLKYGKESVSDSNNIVQLILPVTVEISLWKIFIELYRGYELHYRKFKTVGDNCFNLITPLEFTLPTKFENIRTEHQR